MDWLCADCRQDIVDLDEYFMIHDDLWERTGAGESLLCIGCLETRIGRQLDASDFTRCVLNEMTQCQSPRLISRIMDDGNGAA